MTARLSATLTIKLLGIFPVFEFEFYKVKIIMIAYLENSMTEINNLKNMLYEKKVSELFCGIVPFYFSYATMNNK